MLNQSEQSRNEDSSINIVLLFIFGGFLISMLMFSGFCIADDILHSSFDWHKTIGWAFFMGIFGSFLTMPVSLIAGAIATSFGLKKLKKLPLWYLLIVLSICAIGLCVQNRLDGFFFSELTWRYFSKGLAPILICYLIAYWRLAKKEQPQ